MLKRLFAGKQEVSPVDPYDSIFTPQFYNTQAVATALKIINSPSKEQADQIIADFKKERPDDWYDKDSPPTPNDTGKYFLSSFLLISRRGTYKYRVLQMIVFADQLGMIPPPQKYIIELDVTEVNGELVEYIKAVEEQNRGEPVIGIIHKEQ